MGRGAEKLQKLNLTLLLMGPNWAGPWALVES